MKKSITLLPLLLYFLLLQAQTDTVPPVLECHNITNFFFLTLECWDTIQVHELIDTVYDDQSVAGTIELGMRRSCTGEGFPTLQELIVSAGIVANIDVWAKDAAGNTTVKTVSVYLSIGSCDYIHFLIAKTRPANAWSEPQRIHDVNFDFRLVHGCTEDTTYVHKNTGNSGEILGFGTVVPRFGYTVELEVSKNINPANGVTATDLVLISRHILGIEPLNSPYKIIAADASQDGNVTVYDIVLLRKLILGLIDELPNGRSWRFIPKEYVFPNPANPFSPMFPSGVTTTNAEPASSDHEYIGVKIGDVNFSADPAQ